jgi:putative hemolysin
MLTAVTDLMWCTSIVGVQQRGIPLQLSATECRLATRVHQFVNVAFECMEQARACVWILAS